MTDGIVYRMLFLGRNFVSNAFSTRRLPGVNRGYSRNLGRPWIRPCSIFSKILNWLLFRWILWMYQPNLKSVALPIPEIEVLGVAYAISILSYLYIWMLFQCTSNCLCSIHTQSISFQLQDVHMPAGVQSINYFLCCTK